MLLDRKKGTSEERKVVRGDTSTTFQMRIVLFLSFSGDSDDLFTTTNILCNTDAEVFLPPPTQASESNFPFL